MDVKKRKKKIYIFLGSDGHTWVDASATAGTAVVLFSHNYLPPDWETNQKSEYEQPTTPLTAP